MDSTPTGPRSAFGRWVLLLLERRPLVGGVLLLVLGAGLVCYAVVWETAVDAGTSAGGPPGGMIVSFGGGAGLVLAFVGARSLGRGYRRRKTTQL